MNVGATARCTLLSAFVFVACGTGSGEANETDQPTVQVSASGRVQAAPDIVTLNVRVVTENLRSAVAARYTLSHFPRRFRLAFLFRPAHRLAA